ncbi:MAG: hypothetical protein N3F65_00300 [Nitrososphaeria archaeon]|nr:hypothetical protein [Nitrososphaeria archaeon]MDW8021304.1 hypothetical protein [Nitrososphaerota archaeon]
MDKFEEDILCVKDALARKFGARLRDEVERIANRFIELHKENRVKINHSVMEYVLAAHLAARGYEVDVEYPLEDGLVADLMASKDGRKMIIEVETGFTSPENALDPQGFLTARVISKIARYSVHADKFSLATPAHNILQIPTILLKPVKRRRAEEINLLKELCDRYYATPTVAREKFADMKLHLIYVINVDILEIKQLTPKKYLEIFRDLCPDKNQIIKYLGAGIRSRVAYERAPP